MPTNVVAKFTPGIAARLGGAMSRGGSKLLRAIGLKRPAETLRRMGSSTSASGSIAIGNWVGHALRAQDRLWANLAQTGLRDAKLMKRVGQGALGLGGLGAGALGLKAFGGNKAPAVDENVGAPMATDDGTKLAYYRLGQQVAMIKCAQMRGR